MSKSGNLVIIDENDLNAFWLRVKDFVQSDLRRERLLKKEDEDDWITRGEAMMILDLKEGSLFKLVKDNKVTKSPTGYYSRKSIIKYKSGR